MIKKEMEPIPTTFTKISVENIKQEVFDNVEDTNSRNESTNESIDKSQDVEESEGLHDDIEDKIDEELDRIDKDQIGKFEDVFLEESYL